MKVGKGNIQRQRRRRNDRYRGCRVCGVRGVHCTECTLTVQIVATHGAAALMLVVDGSFVESPVGEALGHGGAGLVLVRVRTGQGRSGETSEVLASRACGFRTDSSTDAEQQAIIRAARWAPRVAIYTDVRELPAKMWVVNHRLAVHYLPPNDRAEAYALAHRLSVEGRCREAPETIPPVGLAPALDRAGLTKTQRKQRGAAILLDHARRDPSFDGDFTAIAEKIGWTSGKLGRQNPAIRIATDRWREKKGA